MTFRGQPPSAILETALYASDLASAARFYGGVLGLETVAEVPGRHVFFRCGKGMLLLFRAEATRRVADGAKLPVPPHGSTGPGHVCFAASAGELDGWHDRFVADGIEIDADFCWPSGARSIYVRDPAGNSVEFAEPRLWGF